MHTQPFQLAEQGANLPHQVTTLLLSRSQHVTDIAPALLLCFQLAVQRLAPAMIARGTPATSPRLQSASTPIACSTLLLLLPPLQLAGWRLNPSR
jgi:hypothetical protein